MIERVEMPRHNIWINGEYIYIFGGSNSYRTFNIWYRFSVKTKTIDQSDRFNIELKLVTISEDPYESIEDECDLLWRFVHPPPMPIKE
ncbi:hypothetical protein PPL_02579 [Heterostelium album PN500]|uniref:Uncharacterized protein n=1 Tax=Heterostelium pallidum (strain ATCC 26659 / Pp 5 / PN500) TaxID=670386 RepID=D3B2G6_HETP5|nr:hypothetical protein PPL_02579 [Heterostelium album PN500]EFA83514.1 hypothetical protein PPL_02579 [Heterostelium album PN500]|eukprot:XP_020435631.1 hypothetical protein PPL_02579 [Heterostelium album PN500]